MSLRYFLDYRDVLTVPKLIIGGSADEFFMPDDYDYFFGDLLGEKYVWVLENTGHGISDGPLYDEVWTMLETFYIAIIKVIRRTVWPLEQRWCKTGGIHVCMCALVYGSIYA